MTAYSTRQWQLSSNDVHSRQALFGFRIAPDELWLSFVLQRDKKIEEGTVSGRTRVKEVPLADICLLSVDGGYPRQLTTSGTYSKPPTWSPDGTSLLVEGDERLLVMDLHTGNSSTVYEGSIYTPPLEDGDEYLGRPCWSPDGETILFATRKGQETRLVLVSKDGRLYQELFAIDGYLIGWDWSPDGCQVLAVGRSNNGFSGAIWLLDTQNGSASTLWEEAEYEYQKPVATWVPGRARIIFRSNRTGWSKLWMAEPNGKNQQPLTSGQWDDYSFRYSPGGGRIVYASRQAQSGTSDDLWILDLDTTESSRLTDCGGVNVPIAWSSAGQVFYWHCSPTEPGELWSIASTGGEPKRLTYSAPVHLERKLQAPLEVVIDSEGGAIPTLIYLPAYFKDGQRYPAIVWVRGGPTEASRFEYAPFYNWLANNGFVVLTPNYRGSTSCGVAHMSAVAGEGVGSSDLADILATGNYAKDLPYVDLGRGVGVGGHSWGGYLTLMAVTHAPDLFSCGVAMAAISDWRIQQAQTEVRYYDYWLVGGWLHDRLQHAIERSPVTMLDRIKVPLLIQHGGEDRDVPFAQIEAFVRKARAVGVDVEYVTHPVEGHSTKKPENQEQDLERVCAFYRRHLQNWNFHDNPGAGQIQY